MARSFVVGRGLETDKRTRGDVGSEVSRLAIIFGGIICFPQRKLRGQFLFICAILG